MVYKTFLLQRKNDANIQIEKNRVRNGVACNHTPCKITTDNEIHPSVFTSSKDEDSC